MKISTAAAAATLFELLVTQSLCPLTKYLNLWLINQALQS